MLPNATFSDPSAQAVTLGNPDLESFTSTNVDLGGEWYTGDEKVTSAWHAVSEEHHRLHDRQRDRGAVQQPGAAGYHLRHPQPHAANRDQFARGGPGAATVNATQQINAAGRCASADMRPSGAQPLTRLLDGLGFQLNYTGCHATSGRQQWSAGVAVGISPTTYNATAPHYDHGPASIRLSYVYNDKQIARARTRKASRATGSDGRKYSQLDLSASWCLGEPANAPQLTLNVINITGETQRQTWGNDSIQFDNAARTFYDPGFCCSLGVRGTF